MNEFEEHFNEKKKKFKYEIRLVDEHKQLENIQSLDPANVDAKIMEKVGIHIPSAGNEVLNKFRDQMKLKGVNDLNKTEEQL